MKEFKFDFTEFGSSVRNLYEFLDVNIELNAKYHVCFVSSVLYKDENSYRLIVIDDLEFSVNSINGFIEILEYNKHSLSENDKVPLESLEVISIYFIPFIGDVGVKSILYFLYRYINSYNVRFIYMGRSFCIGDISRTKFMYMIIDSLFYCFKDWIKFYVFGFYNRFLKKFK